MAKAVMEFFQEEVKFSRSGIVYAHPRISLSGGCETFLKSLFLPLSWDLTLPGMVGKASRRPLRDKEITELGWNGKDERAGINSRWDELGFAPTKGGLGRAQFQGSVQGAAGQGWEQPGRV